MAGSTLRDPADGLLSIHPDGLVVSVADDAASPACCCSPAEFILLRACRCGARTLGSIFPCVSTGPCRWVRGDTRLTDAPAAMLQERFCEVLAAATLATPHPITVDALDACYELTGEWAFVASTPPEARDALRAQYVAGCDTPPKADVPDDEELIGGSSVTLRRAAACGAAGSCPPVSGQPRFHEAFSCSLADAAGTTTERRRVFICTTYPGAAFTTSNIRCRCIDRSRFYTDQEVADLVAAGLATAVGTVDWRTPPNFDLDVVNGATVKVPGRSCCTCSVRCLRCDGLVATSATGPNGGEVMTRRTRCGGTVDGTYSIAYHHTERRVENGIASYDLLEDLVAIAPITGGVRASFAGRTIVRDPQDGTVVSNTPIAYTRDFALICTFMQDLRQNGAPIGIPGNFVSSVGTYGSEWIRPSQPDGARDIFTRYWSGILASSRGPGYTRTTTGSWALADFTGSADITDVDTSASDTWTVTASLSVTLVRDLSAPCSDSGGCGPAGGTSFAGLPITELLL